MKTSIALIINTYDQPDYLRRVLDAVSAQTQMPTEVVIADDGSDRQTADVIKKWSAEKKCRCEHVWQSHTDFRRSRILNLAIARVTADYVVFLDGDTLPHPKFVADHASLARRKRFMQGHRALIGHSAARTFGRNEPFLKQRWDAFIEGDVKGWKNLYRWPMPVWRTRKDLRGVRGCNLGVWRADLEKVNGYNEEFTGWGKEDSELAVRLINNGVLRRDVRGWAICYHLWHAPISRAKVPANEQLLADALRERRKSCRLGLSQHTSSAQAQSQTQTQSQSQSQTQTK